MGIITINYYIIKQVAENKQVMYEDTTVKHTIITAKLNWKLYTKVIKSVKLIGLGSDSQIF
jgi:hypothetical protein